MFFLRSSKDKKLLFEANAVFFWLQPEKLRPKISRNYEMACLCRNKTQSFSGLRFASIELFMMFPPYHPDLNTRQGPTEKKQNDYWIGIRKKFRNSLFPVGPVFCPLFLSFPPLPQYGCVESCYRRGYGNPRLHRVFCDFVITRIDG